MVEQVSEEFAKTLYTKEVNSDNFTKKKTISFILVPLKARQSLGCHTLPLRMNISTVIIKLFSLLVSCNSIALNLSLLTLLIAP